MEIKSEQEMLAYGRDFAEKLKSGQDLVDIDEATVIELVGDVGAGKTTFVRGLAEGLGVKELVTSPSFTISKTYVLPNGGQLVHYDFYRLAEPGLMSEDLQESIIDARNVVIVEWGESVSDLLPKKHIIIQIDYTDSGRKIIA